MHTCRICGSQSEHEPLRLREMFFGFREMFDYFRCADCRTVQIAEIPADLAKYYPQDYYSYVSDPERNVSWKAWGYLKTLALFAPFMRFYLLSHNPIARTVRGTLARIELYLLMLEGFTYSGIHRNSSVLDVGSGSGYIPYCLKQIGIRRVVAVDPFLAEDRHYRNGFSVLKQDLPGYAATSPEPFDLVMFHHSLEHMPEPVEPLRNALRLLRPGGAILVRLPIADCDAYDRYRENLVSLDPPRHLFIPSQQGLQIAAEKAGLQIDRVVFDSTDFQFWASEQYIRDIPLVSDKSLFQSTKNSVFTKAELAQFRQQARDCNRRGRGDGAAFILRRKSSGPSS